MTVRLVRLKPWDSLRDNCANRALREGADEMEVHVTGELEAKLTHSAARQGGLRPASDWPIRATRLAAETSGFRGGRRAAE